MRDDFDDIIDELKKFLNLKSDMFDIDVLFLPEKDIDLGIKPDDKKMKGFKISYHYENGMDKPDVKIEGNINDEKIKEFLKNADLKNIRRLKKLVHTKRKKEIDASQLTLEPIKQDEGIYVLEPYTEVNENTDYIEIIIEVPGMKRENIMIDFRNEGNLLAFTAQNEKRKYFKKINLPCKLLMENYELQVNNGIAYIKIKKISK